MDVVKTHKTLIGIITKFKAAGQKIVFVPTMGALHKGHLSLIERAKQSGDKVVVSIFVNPAQFAPDEDFDTYPRNTDTDTRRLRDADVDVLYMPSVDEIYPDGRQNTHKAGKAAQGLESEFRPTFFDGVVNVVARLFDHVRPDAAVFGEKDYQQLCVIREMVAAHKMNIDMIAAPIMRDKHGLALSSRNAALKPKEIDIARTLNTVLKIARDDIKNDVAFNAKKYSALLIKNGFDSVDYFALRDAADLSSAPQAAGRARLLVAAWIDNTRLIDNIAVDEMP